MQKKERKVVESPRGVGKLKKGDDYIADVSYKLLISKDVIIADSFGNHPQEIDGMGQITGTFKIINGGGNIKGDETYTLQLPDGREMDIMMPSFIFRDTQIKIYPVKTEKFISKK